MQEAAHKAVWGEAQQKLAAMDTTQEEWECACAVERLEDEIEAVKQRGASELEALEVVLLHDRF